MHSGILPLAQAVVVANSKPELMRNFTGRLVSRCMTLVELKLFVEIFVEKF